MAQFNSVHLLIDNLLKGRAEPALSDDGLVLTTHDFMDPSISRKHSNASQLDYGYCLLVVLSRPSVQAMAFVGSYQPETICGFP